jgi:hypothetical protein
VDAQIEGMRGHQPLLVADTYAAAAQLSFHGQARGDVYTLAHPMGARHGRALQYKLWGLDEQGLAAHAGRNALVVLDRDGTRRREASAWEQHVHSLFDRLEWVGRVDVRVRSFDVLWATGIRARPAADAPP